MGWPVGDEVVRAVRKSDWDLGSWISTSKAWSRA